MGILDRFRLDGHVALITGGGGGLGHAMATAFADVGADVCVTARKLDKLEAVRRDVEARGRRCAVISADVTSEDGPTTITEHALKELEKITILVNNAGGLGGVDKAPQPLMKTSDASWEAQIALNLTSAWRMTKACVPEMKDGGVIINISSILGLKPQGAGGGYGASKAAMNNMTIALAHDLAPRFRVNGIAPGPVPTEAFKKARKVTEADFARVAQEWGVPLGRVGTPEDVSATAVYLASDAGSWMTGQTLLLAGGM